MKMFRLSNAAVITTNAILAVIGLAAVSFSIYLFIQGPTQCQRYVQNPMIATSTLVFFISTLGLIAALYDNHIIITIYLLFLFLAILLLLSLSFLIFLVTNPTAGKALSDKGFGSFRTGDLQNWIGNRFLHGKTWERINQCLAVSRICQRFGPNDVNFDSKHLSSIQFGCCRPPVECGFQAKNATYWVAPDAAGTGTGTLIGDCKEWSNTQNELCYSCESCKIGVLKGIRRRWKALLIFNICIFLLVVLLYSCGCCVRRNNRVPWKRRFL